MKYNGIKKVLALALALALLPAIGFANFTDVPAGTQVAEAVDTLVAMEVLSGYGDGTFGPDDTLTRAQFAKIAVIMTGAEKEATGIATVFSDVEKSHWANGYIKKVATDGIITGYPNGTFCPDEEITYAQAITIMIRMLGYSGADVGYNWPDSYLDKAAILEITEGLSFAANDPISRGVAAIMLCRTLECDMKTGDTLYGKMKLKKVEDAVVYGTKAVNAALAGDDVVTGGGSFKTGGLDMDRYLGQKADLLINDDNEIVKIVPDTQVKKEVVIDEVFSDALTVQQQSAKESVQLKEGTTVYYKGAKSTFEGVRANMTTGSRADIYYENGVVDYLYLYEEEMEGPYTVRVAGQIETYFGKLDSPAVYRNGERAGIEDIAVHDVVYYLPTTNSVYAYDNPVTGIYESAAPLKSNLERITLSGVTYTIDSPTAKAKLDESAGAFRFDDRITLLLGKDNEVVDVIDPDSEGLYSIGVVTNTYSELSTDADTAGKTDYYAEILLGDGSTASYKTKQDEEDLIGDFVHISFAGGYADLKKPSYNAFGGSFDKIDVSFAGHDFAQNYVIFERIDVPNSGAATVQIIDLKDIDTRELLTAKVIHVEYANSMQDILAMYVDNVTKSAYNYGILTQVQNSSSPMSVSGSYEIFDDGTTQSFRGLNYAFTSVSKGDPVGYEVVSGQLKNLKTLVKVGTGTTVEDFTSEKIKVSGTVYKMQNAKVYQKDGNGGYKMLSLEEIKGEKFNNINLFADATMASNGKVRVIIVA